MSFDRMIWTFFIYSFLGWCMEVGYAAMNQKKFVNRGFLHMPICPIYGIGVVLVVELLSGLKHNLLLFYVVSTVALTLLEWFTGVVLEKLFHCRWWDYSKEWLNIQGYVCLPFSLIWGIAGIIIILFVHPIVLKLIALIPAVPGRIILIMLLIVLIIDLAVTISEILHMNLNLKKMKQITEELQEKALNLGEKARAKIDRQEQYQELLSSISSRNRRFIHAFPKIQSMQYKKQLQDIKAFLRNNGSARK